MIGYGAGTHIVGLLIRFAPVGRVSFGGQVFSGRRVRFSGRILFGRRLFPGWRAFLG